MVHIIACGREYGFRAPMDLFPNEIHFDTAILGSVKAAPLINGYHWTIYDALHKRPWYFVFLRNAVAKIETLPQPPKATVYISDETGTRAAITALRDMTTLLRRRGYDVKTETPNLHTESLQTSWRRVNDRVF